MNMTQNGTSRGGGTMSNLNFGQMRTHQSPQTGQGMYKAYNLKLQQ